MRVNNNNRGTHVALPRHPVLPAAAAAAAAAVAAPEAVAVGQEFHGEVVVGVYGDDRFEVRETRALLYLLVPPLMNAKRRLTD